MPKNKRNFKLTKSTSVTITEEQYNWLVEQPYSISIMVRSFVKVMMDNEDKMPSIMEIIKEAIIENGDEK